MNDIDQPRIPMHLHALTTVETRVGFGRRDHHSTHSTLEATRSQIFEGSQIPPYLGSQRIANTFSWHP